MKYKVDFIRSSYQRFYKAHKKEIDNAISKCQSKGNLIMESEVEKFEKNFAKFCKRKYCITVSSGTVALVLTAVLGKFRPLNEYRYRIPPEIIDNNSEILLVTYMNSVRDFSNIPKERCGLLIEDACQAVGVPLVGDVSCFSFYPAKMIGGLGKGGALVTDNKDIYEKLKRIRDDKWNNIWLDEISAAFLNVKLKYLPQLLKRRKEIAEYYNKHLPEHMIFNKNCLQNYIIKVLKDEEFIKYMKKNGIECFSDKSDFYEGNLEHAVRLPIYAELTDAEVKYIVKMVNKFYE